MQALQGSRVRGAYISHNLRTDLNSHLKKTLQVRLSIATQFYPYLNLLRSTMHDNDPEVRNSEDETHIILMVSFHTGSRTRKASYALR